MQGRIREARAISLTWDDYSNERHLPGHHGEEKGGVQDLRGLTLVGDGAAARAPAAPGLPVGRRGGHGGVGRVAFGRRGGCEGGGGTFGGSGSSRGRPLAHLQFLHKRLRQIHSYHLEGEMIKADIQQRTFDRLSTRAMKSILKNTWRQKQHY